MFLMTISHNLCNQLFKNIYQNLGQTIHKYFHKVLEVMVIFSREVITHSSFNDSPMVFLMAS